MGTQSIRCDNCSGAVKFAPGSSMTVCEYCGVQLQLSGNEPEPAPTEPTGPTLATSIGVRVTPSLTIPLLTAYRANRRWRFGFFVCSNLRRSQRRSRKGEIDSVFVCEHNSSLLPSCM